MTASYPLIAAMAGMILLSRPLLEARRVPASILLLLGIMAGPSVTGLAPANLIGAVTPLFAVAAGWLALLATESWDLDSLRRHRAGRRILMMGIPAGIIIVLALVWPTALVVMRGLAALASILAPAVILACASNAIDPEASREMLARSSRPAAAARLAPMVATLALGSALFASTLASGLHATVTTLLPWVVIWHPLGTLFFGAAFGLLFTGLLRLAQGRGSITVLLVALPLICYGVARQLEMPPLAMIFVAGCVVANDPVRRDLVFTLLREHQRAATVVVLLIAGARVPIVAGLATLAVFWLMALSFAVARPLAWRFVPRTGPGADNALPMSPLAMVLALEILAWQGGTWILPVLIPSVVAVAFVLNEATWIVIVNRTSGTGGSDPTGMMVAPAAGPRSGSTGS